MVMPHAFSPVRPGPVFRLGTLVSGGWHRVRLAQLHRRDRRVLYGLSDHLLRDIGLSPENLEEQLRCLERVPR